MSIRVMAAVWEHSQHKGSALLLLLSIADHAHDDGTGAHPSITTLAKKVRMTPRNVQFIITKLEESRELIVTRDPSRNSSNHYSIDLQFMMKSFQGENFSGRKLALVDDENQRQFMTKSLSYKPSKNHQSNHSPQTPTENTEPVPVYLPPLAESLEGLDDFDPTSRRSHSRNETQAQSASAEGKKVCGAAGGVTGAGSKEAVIEVFLEKYPWCRAELEERGKTAHTSPVGLMHTIVLGWIAEPSTIPAKPEPPRRKYTAEEIEAIRAKRERQVDEEFWASREKATGKTREQLIAELPAVSSPGHSSRTSDTTSPYRWLDTLKNPVTPVRAAQGVAN